MLTMEKTADYVKRWVAAFEAKDLDRVLAFYTDDVIFHSPLVARLSHDPSGTVQGKAALRAYVKKGFEVFDHIKFTVLDVLRGVDSIAIHYEGHGHACRRGAVLRQERRGPRVVRALLVLSIEISASETSMRADFGAPSAASPPAVRSARRQRADRRGPLRTQGGFRNAADKRIARAATRLCRCRAGRAGPSSSAGRRR